MKYKVTKKSVNERFDYVISVPYCGLQNLLETFTPQEYTCGIDGWHADIYIFGNTAIVTGYQPFGNYKPPYDLCQKFEREAEEMSKKYRCNYEALTIHAKELTQRFIQEAVA